MLLKKSSLTAQEYLKLPYGQEFIGSIGLHGIFDREDMIDLYGKETIEFANGIKSWLFDFKNTVIRVYDNSLTKRVTISVKDKVKEQAKKTAQEFREILLSEFKKKNLKKWELGMKSAKMEVTPGWKYDPNYKFMSEMFHGHEDILPAKEGANEDKTHRYQAVISIWTLGSNSSTMTIFKDEKILWEHKSNNLHNIHHDLGKLKQMIDSLNIDQTKIKIIKKKNGKIVDDIEEHLELEEGRLRKIPKRRGLNVGDINDLNDKQIELIVPRNDLDKRKELLKPLLDNGHKIINTIRNGKMDIITMSKPLSENTEDLNEYVLNFQQRRKRAMTMRKFKNKIKTARERKAKRLATGDQLKIRARRMAIQIIRRKFAGKLGADYKNLSVSQKIMVDKKVESKKGLVKKIAQRILPRIRKQEAERFKNRSKIKSEQNVTITS